MGNKNKESYSHTVIHFDLLRCKIHRERSNYSIRKTLKVFISYQSKVDHRILSSGNSFSVYFKASERKVGGN